jgi:hypothetical protein
MYVGTSVIRLVLLTSVWSAAYLQPTAVQRVHRLVETSLVVELRFQKPSDQPLLEPADLLLVSAC